MKRRYPVPARTVALQSMASDPGHSAWVSANAGSGKTHVLAQRVIRLLLDGTDPSRILCLTYTRAAASNMSNRIFEILARWTVLDDAELGMRVAETEGRKPGAERLACARRLFAAALETPGGLKIQTIHAFCESVLQQFPLEANVPAHFRLLDPLMEAALFAEARRELLTGAVGAGESRLREAFATILERGGEFALDELLSAILLNRDALRRFLDAAGGDAAPLAGLREEFGFAPEETAASAAAAAWPLADFDGAFMEAYIAAAQAAGASFVLKNIVPPLRQALAEPDPMRRLGLLEQGLLTGKGEAYGAGRVGPAAMLARLPGLAERYDAAVDALKQACERVALLRLLENTGAAMAIADWLIGRYEQLKAGRGFLDFNDLITRTVNLLMRQDAGQWVQYKLDKGIDHILLDEAQDTSPDQWQVVTRLAEEFFSGAGARDSVRRTVFAVGDEKQSIYSFQGAAPESFERTREALSVRIAAARRRIERVPLYLSFRSTEDVLRAVDAVFASPETRRGVSFGDAWNRHEAIRAGAPGYVEWWPSIGAESVEEPDDWRIAIDHAKAPAVRLAETIATTIRGWLDAGEVIEGTGKRLSPGDVLVLVRKRGSFVNALSRSLKERHIAVAGADRLRLSGHIAVRDMMALGRFLLQPQDDLSLAAVLKSPVFGFDEDRLMALAAGREPGVSLIGALRARAGTDADCAGAAAQLDRWASEAAFRRPFDFYAGVLERDGVRAAMAARLGRDAADILDELLSFCLAQEQTGLPGLEAFLATLESAAPEIRREMDQTRDEIRIMTVHAAKGLEAPVVFLVDDGSAPFHHQHLPRLMRFEPRGPLAGVPAFLWRAQGERGTRIEHEGRARFEQRAEEEYRRLLYVAMTRAEDRLIVCGHHGAKAPAASRWHAIVQRALDAAPETRDVAHPFTGETVRRFCIAGRTASAAAAPGMRDERPPAALPDAIRAPLEPLPPLPRPLAPSGASALVLEKETAVVAGRSPVLDAQEDAGFAVERGLCVHRLLQMLPSWPQSERGQAAARYLERTAPAWPQHEREAACAAVLAILDEPQFGPLFAPQSRAEVAVMGHVEVRGVRRPVAGTIDRMVVTEDAVRIVDYKTNRPAPVALEEVPPAYVTQLALYRALLQPIYPGRRIEAALLFTEGPRLMPLPAALLDAALARLTKA